MKFHSNNSKVRTYRANEINNLRAISEWSNKFLNVFILDDDPSIVNHIRKIIENTYQARIYSFVDETEAIRALYDIKFDICIVDVFLAHSNGLALGRLIHSMAYNKFPIIYISKDKDSFGEFRKNIQPNTFFYPKPIQKETFSKVLINTLSLTK